MNKYQAAVLINLEFQQLSKSIQNIALYAKQMPEESEYKKEVQKIKLAELYTKLEKDRIGLKVLSFNQ